MSVRNRIYRSLAANAFGQAIGIGAQLLLTPLYFLAWGAPQYGEWLLLSTIPAYLVMADIGLGSAAANEMAILASANQHKAAQSTFWGAVRVIHYAALIVLLSSLAFALLSESMFHASFGSISRLDTGLIIFLLGCGVGVNFYMGIASSGFRASGRNASGIVIANCVRLAELVACGVLLLLHCTPLFLCVAAFSIRFAGLGVQVALLKKYCAWIFASGIVADRKLFRRLIKPSLSFLAFPLGNAMALQGPLLIIGLLFGSTAVAVFSTLRTLSRIPLQVANVFNASIWPEMSTAYGARDFALMRKLHQQSLLATALLAGSISGAILFAGPLIVNTWLGAKVAYDATMLLALLTIASAMAVWGISGMLLTAINAHSRMVTIYLLVNSVCLGLAYAAGILLGQHWFLAPLVLSELAMFGIAFPMALRASGDTLATFIRSQWTYLSQALFKPAVG
jgi:O-antigen/teichoic acid export membrane protein